MKCLSSIVLLAILSPGDEVPLRPQGITAEAEETIRSGLDYLAKSQGKDGSWRSGGGYGSYPTAMTSLAGLALIAGGNTPSRGKYAPELRRAVDYILKQSHRSGLISSPDDGRSMYGHGFSMLFLAQVLGMEEDAERMGEIQKALGRAVQLTSRSQSAMGGWTYTPDMNADEGSVTVTQVQALRACRNAGVKVPKKTIDQAIKYIEKSANRDGGIAYTAAQGGGGGSRPPITAAAVATLYNAGEYDSPMAAKALEYCDKHITVSGQGVQGHYYYAHFYLAQAYYQAGGERWDEYFPEMRDRLVKNQRKDGSWNDGQVGEIYTSSIALIILQLPYKNLPICQR